jgi:hypothetical protein
MNRKFIYSLSGLLLAAMASGAVAGPKEELIELDMQWGTTGMTGDVSFAATLLSDDLISVSEDGIGGKQDQLANNEPAPAGSVYEVTDFKVVFLDDNTAVMSHSVAGDQAHYSMHVWSKKSGKWQVVATSSTPAHSE